MNDLPLKEDKSKKAVKSPLTVALRNKVEEIKEKDLKREQEVFLSDKYSSNFNNTSHFKGG